MVDWTKNFIQICNPDDINGPIIAELQSGINVNITNTSLETTIELPTVSIVDWRNLDGEGYSFFQDDSQFLTDYSVDVEALPIATLPNVYLGVKARAFQQPYPQLGADQLDNTNFGTSQVTQKVVFPPSMVLPVQNAVNGGTVSPILIGGEVSIVGGPLDTNIDIPTTTIDDWINYPEGGEGNGVYTADIEALPIATPVGTYLGVHQRVQAFNYPTLGSDLDDTDTFNEVFAAMKVVFPNSLVLPIQNPNVGGTITPLQVSGEVTIGGSALDVNIVNPAPLQVEITGQPVDVNVTFPATQIVDFVNQSETVTSVDETRTANFTIPAGFIHGAIAVLSGSLEVNGAIYTAGQTLSLPPMSFGKIDRRYPAYVLEIQGPTTYRLNYHT